MTEEEVLQLRKENQELREALMQTQEQLQPHLDALKTQVRASPALQMDETGWREDGENCALVYLSQL